MKLEDKKSLLIEMELWFRKNYPTKKRIGTPSTSVIYPFFEEKYGFKHEPKHCRVCNKKLVGKHYRYCSDNCREIANMFSWDTVKRMFSAISKNHSCAICGQVRHYGENDVDHIRPISKGGLEFNLDNLRYLCPHCNRSRKLKHLHKVSPQKEINLNCLFERQRTLKEMQ